MTIEPIDFTRTGNFSRLFLDYVAGDPKLSHTYSFPPSVQGFERALSYRKFPAGKRKKLYEVLKQQYDGVDCDLAVRSNLELLKGDNTFTVTTGHQLNIFSGPLFFLYKIITTINIAKELAVQYPEYNFVPVYWMATEDHDFEEINHVFVGGERYEWQTDQTGAVGRFKTDGLAELADQIEGRTGLFREAYANNETLAEAVRCYVNKLFHGEGLVVLDADDPVLKAAFIDVVKDDLVQHSAYHCVTRRSQHLTDNGYRPQLNPREINLFYLAGNLRKRIVRAGDRYQVVESEISFAKEELLELVEKSPEKFSPNVILRPLYQEMILPNLGYVGGPAELAYWLQLKEMFDEFKVDFPVLMPRNFGLYVPGNIQRKIEKLNIKYDQLFSDLNELKKLFVKDQLNGKLSLEEQKKAIAVIYESVASLAVTVDPTLKPFVKAEAQRVVNSMQNIEGKMVKAEKRKREDEMRMLTQIKENLFPGGTLQERRLNILGIHDENFIEQVAANTDPFDLRFNIYKA
jgi:bacillithiol biosynthesis cysteine-adding enzyme BshC